MVKVDTTPHTVRFTDIWISTILYVGLASIIHFAIATERNRIEQNLRIAVSHDVLEIASRLESELNANVFLAHGMVAFVSAVDQPRDAEFNSALESIFRFGRHVRNVAVAPDNRIAYIYPHEGNEAAIGLYYPDIPEQWPAVEQAIRTGNSLLAGPVDLKQGGTGLISRTPLFNAGGQYWGILSLVLDADSLFSTVGLRPEVGKIRFALRGKDGKGASGEIILGDPSLFDTESITAPISVPGGTWSLAAAPTAGWKTGQAHLAVAELLALLTAVIPAVMLYRYQRARRLLAENENRLRVILNTALDGVVIYNDSGNIQEFNPAAETLFGFQAQEVFDTPVSRLMPESGARGAFPERNDLGQEVICVRKDGTRFHAEMTIGDVSFAGRLIHVGVIRDITERKEIERKLRSLASTDALTGTLNRRAFLEAATEAFLLSRRHARALSILMVDADHFKKINDTYGHHAGDIALVRLTEIFSACMRTTDKLGRVGGEEFAILLPETTLSQADAVIQRILESVRSTLILLPTGEQIHVTVSIGASGIEDTLPDVMTMIDHADKALYLAKQSGRNTSRQFPTSDSA